MSSAKHLCKAKTVEREVLKFGASLTSDVLQGKNLKQCAINREKETSSTSLQIVAAFTGERKRPFKRKKKKLSKANHQKHNIFI